MRLEMKETPNQTLTGPSLLLASTSPRRHEIMSRAGLAHRIINPGLDDGQLIPGQASPGAWAASLAFLKAQAALNRWRDDDAPEHSLIIGADTICVHESRIIGQPLDIDDARRILMSFDDTVHEVITGVAVIDSATGRREIFVDRANVWWDGVGVDRIEEYLATGQWAGKAGAYNLSERLDAGWPIRYQGSPNTIMGLPIEQLRGRLERWHTAPVEPAA